MRKENLKLFLVLIVAFVLRLINLNQSFWLDEAAQVIESSRFLLQQFDLVADFHPPLYHVLLHFWLYLGRSEIWVRLLSISFALGSVLLIYKIGKLLADKKVALVNALFLTLSPYHIWYSQEARPYMAFLFFSLFSTFLLLKKNWFWYTILLVFSLYTHYFTLFLMVSHFIHVLFFEKRLLRKFIVSSMISLVAFAAWMPELLRQLAVGTGGFFAGWTSVVSTTPAKTAVLTFAKFIFGRGSIENNIQYTLVIFPVFLFFIFSLIKIWKIKSGKILTNLFLVPFIFSEAVSFIVPINAPQRLIFLLPIFYLIITFGIYDFPKKIRALCIFIVILTSLGGIYQYYTDPYVQREQWRQAVTFTERTANSQSVALFVFPGPFAPYTWYAQGKIEALGIAPKFILTDEDLTTLAVRLSGKKRIYLYQYLTGLTDPTDKIRNFLAMESFSQSSIDNFPGVGFIYTYDKK